MFDRMELIGRREPWERTISTGRGGGCENYYIYTDSRDKINQSKYIVAVIVPFLKT